MKILGVVPARGGSKGIPRKNIVFLAGKPLITYTLEAAIKAERLNRIIVSTEDEEIASLCRVWGVEVLNRPVELADDKASTRSVLLDVIERMAKEKYFPDAVMTLQPTSPLRRSTHIDDAASLFVSDSEADSLVSCEQIPHTHHPLSVMRKDTDGYLRPFHDVLQPTRRQDKDEVFARNGAAIYITKTENLSSYIFGGRLLPYLMTRQESIDIDSYSDLIAAEKILREESYSQP